jgi:signal transduction histidine kinase
VTEFAAPEPTDARWTRLFDLSTHDRRMLDATRRQREAIADELSARFHADLIDLPELRLFLDQEPERLRHLQAMHHALFVGLGGPEMDAERLGSALHGLAIPPQLRSARCYVGMCTRYLTLVVRLLSSAIDDRGNLGPAIEAITKAVMLQLATALENLVAEAHTPRQLVLPAGAPGAPVASDVLDRERAVARWKDELVSMLIHDLRNPVHSIALQAKVTLEIARKSLEDERDHLAGIQRACADLSSLLDDMLAARRLATGQMPVALEPLPFDDLLRQVIERQRPLIERAGMRLTSDIPAELPVVRTDPTLLRRILLNLITNAVEHSASPEIRVEAERLGDGVAVRVIDYGRGISPADWERTLRRAPSETASTPATGATSGLGLHFCRLATRQIGGDLRMSSRPGLTVFEVLLPTDRESAPAAL